MLHPRITLCLTFAVLCTVLLTLPSAVSGGELDPPEDVLLEPLVKGLGFNISWNASNMTASLFRVSLVWKEGSLIPVGMGTSAQPWTHLVGLIPGEYYEFVVQSVADDGNTSGPPSDPVYGWPLPPIGYQDPTAPPVMDPLGEYVNTRTVNVSGTARRPGSLVQLEIIPLAKGTTVTLLVRADELTGRFSQDVVLEEGRNLFHAKILNEGSEDSNWSEAQYLTLDIEPPNVVLTGQDGVHRCGSFVNLSMNMSEDNWGIAHAHWSMGPPVNITANSPSLSFRPQNEGHYPILVKVTDLAGNSATMEFDLHVIPNEGLSKLNNLPERLEMDDGSKYKVDLSEWVVIGDYGGNLTWDASEGNGSLFTHSVDGSILTIVTQKGRVGSSNLTITLGDATGPLAEGTFLVVVNPGNYDDIDFSYLILALLAVIGSVAVVGAVPRVRNRLFQTSITDEPEVQPFFMKSVFYIHMDGRMIADLQADAGGQIDSDMISSMFTAIQTFVQESFRDSGRLENIVFGENTLTVIQGKNTYLAMVSYGPLDREFVNKSKGIVRRIEAEFTGVIEEWDGSYSRLAGIEGMISPLMSNNANRSLAEIKREGVPKEVCLLPTIDLQHGFARYNLELTNNTDEILIDLHVDILWDKQVLALVRYEPDGCKIDGRYRLDNIEPGETLKLELFFDPLICLESFIRGSVTYTDIQGRLHTVQMENVLADINCPIFFTVNNANTAMLRKLIEEDLEYKDNKVYRYSAVLKSQQVFDIAKSAVGSYDIQYVRDFVHDEPFVGEAWYYGETKIYNYKVVVCITVREEDCTVEFLVASTLPTTITGLLAELGQLFLKRMDDKYTQGYNVNRVVRRLVKDESMKLREHPSMLMDNLDGNDTPEGPPATEI